MKSHACLLAIVGLLSLGVEVHSQLTYVTLDAAYGYVEGNTWYTYFFIGSEVQQFIDGFPSTTFNRTQFHIPADMNLKAAFVTNNQLRRIYYGDQYGYSVIVNPVTSRRLRYGNHRAFVRDGGPDAAGSTTDRKLVFKGCVVKQRNSYRRWAFTTDMRGCGLPCDVDAAFRYLDILYVVKGDQYWTLGDNLLTVDSGVLFADTFTLMNNFVLRPTITDKK